MVREGTVAVNGAVTKDSSVHVCPGEDRVTVGATEIIYREHVYLMLNKPSGYVSATEDPRDPTVLELAPEEYTHYDLFPVGRLDKDTEGLLVITNDGQLAHQLLSPRKHVPKTYYVKVNGTVSRNHITSFEHGIELNDGYVTKPSFLKITLSGDISEVELTIYEGKFHQVKRMFRALDMEVIYLKRIQMGGLSLDPSLKPGEIRELTPHELELLKKPRY